MPITTAQIQALYDRTGADMTECQKALIEANGNIELAFEKLHQKTTNGHQTAADRLSAGAILIKVGEGIAALVEVNCETDFTTKDSFFLAFANRVAEAALESKATIAELQAQFEAPCKMLTGIINEAVSIRRVQYVEGETVASCRHGNRIGVAVAGNADADTMQCLAMQIATRKPKYITPADVPADVIAEERETQIKRAMDAGQSIELAEQIAEAYIQNFYSKEALTSQLFVMNLGKTVGESLQEKGATVSSFARLEVGESLGPQAPAWPLETTA